MSNKNPKIVLEAITDKVDPANSVNVYSITITRYAFLEMLESPFINADQKFEVSTIIPSAYVMCVENKVLRKYNSKNLDELRSDAFEWADNELNIDDIPTLISCIVNQMKKLNQAAPEGASTDIKDPNAKKN